MLSVTQVTLTHCIAPHPPTHPPMSTYTRAPTHTPPRARSGQRLERRPACPVACTRQYCASSGMPDLRVVSSVHAHTAGGSSRRGIASYSYSGMTMGSEMVRTTAQPMFSSSHSYTCRTHRSAQAPPKHYGTCQFKPMPPMRTRLSPSQSRRPCQTSSCSAWWPFSPVASRVPSATGRTWRARRAQRVFYA